MSKKPAHILTKQKPQQGERHTGENPAVALAAYVAAFGKHYPQTSVEIKRGKSRDGVPLYNVVLNGDKGDRPMSLDEIKEATQSFLH